MPWTPNDAIKHNKKATTEKRRVLWSKVANRALAEYHGQPDADVIAIRTADAALDKYIDRGKRKRH